MSRFGILFAVILFAAQCGSSEIPETSSVPNLGGGVRAVCGSDQILGTPEATISKGACGISEPVRVHFVNGVKLSTPALINCTSARQLSKWVEVSAKPEARQMGEQLVEMNIFASYSCRTRNHRPGAGLSEHSYGNAIDIGGFTFESGKNVTVLDQYYSSQYRSFFSNLRNGACGPFGTVLGPGSDALHRNHFHFDVASYRSGPYCK